MSRTSDSRQVTDRDTDDDNDEQVSFVYDSFCNIAIAQHGAHYKITCVHLSVSLLFFWFQGGSYSCH